MSDTWHDKHIVEEVDGWYFWDEVGLEQYGPYKDIEETKSMMDKYCKKFLDNQFLIKKKEVFIAIIHWWESKNGGLDQWFCSRV